MKFLTLNILFLVSLVGCATSPTPHSEAIPTPKDRVFAFQESVSGKSGVIVVTRDQGFTGSACFYALWIDSILSARLDVGERAKFNVPAGEHLLKVGRDPSGRALCGVDVGGTTQRETIIRENETKYFRFMIGVDGMHDIQRAD